MVEKFSWLSKGISVISKFEMMAWYFSKETHTEMTEHRKEKKRKDEIFNKTVRLLMHPAAAKLLVSGTTFLSFLLFCFLLGAGGQKFGALS